MNLPVLDVASQVAELSKSSSLRLFASEDYFVLRVPLLPVTRWLNGVVPGIKRKAALVNLQSCWNDQRVREAIFLASPSLFERLETWSWCLDDEKDHKLAQAFYRYISRMCTRSTPFGLFSSVSVGSVGHDTNLNVEGLEARLRRHTRLDTAVVAALCEHLTDRPDLRPHMRLRRNDCGHAVGNRWHYIEWLSQKGVRQYRLSSVGISSYLKCALECAGGDGCSVDSLVDVLCAADSEIEHDVALDFVDSLIDNRLLVSTLEPSVTGYECLRYMIDELIAITPNAPSLTVLTAVSEKLQQIDDAGLGRSPEEYVVITDMLTSLCADIDQDRVFHVDMYRNADHLRLPTSVATDIADAAEVCLAYGGRRSGPLDEFCQRFNKRYDGRRIPLLEALDEETGIGSGQLSEVPSALLEDVSWGNTTDQGVDSRGEARLLERWNDAITHGLDEIVLDASDLPVLSDGDRAAIPASLSAVVTLLASDPDSLQQGDYSVLFHGVSGPSSAQMLGRFCYGEPKLAGHVRLSAEREACSMPEAIFAEIVHLPQDRLGNVVCRPLLREYEIPVLGRSGAVIEKRVNLDDLDIEVRGKQITLWSRRLNRRVIPRMSTAHNYRDNALGIYRFLCQLQHQSCFEGNFSWGKKFSLLPRLPRVRCGRVVLAPAQWRIQAEDAKPFLDANDEERTQAAEVLRLARGMPRFVGVIEDDGGDAMAIDFNNPIAIDTLARTLRQKRSLTLVETALNPTQLCVGGTEERYAHEIILPLRRSEPATKILGGGGNVTSRISKLRSRFEPSDTVERREDSISERYRLPGSEWLYYRIYGGASVLDYVLTDTLAPLAESFRCENIIDNWFFIRYADPDWHIRLRFYGLPDRLTAHVMPKLTIALERLQQEGIIARVELATYDRELERYGGPVGMRLCERWFAQDSRRISPLLAIIRGGDAQLRWQLVTTVLIQDLIDFGLDSVQRLDLINYIASCYIHEFGMRKQRLATLGKKYRKYAKCLREICAGGLPDFLDEEQKATIRTVLAADRSERRDIGNALREAQLPGGGLWCQSELLVPSLVHMTCNRWFIDNGRVHEMVLYDLMRRGMESLRAHANQEL